MGSCLNRILPAPSFMEWEEAFEKKDMKAIKRLSRRGPWSVNLKNSRGQTVLGLAMEKAIRYGWAEPFHIIVNAQGLDLNDFIYNGYHYAAPIIDAIDCGLNRNADAVALALIKAGADMNTTNVDHRTVLFLALRNKDMLPLTIEELTKRGALCSGPEKTEKELKWEEERAEKARLEAARLARQRQRELEEEEEEEEDYDDEDGDDDDEYDDDDDEEDYQADRGRRSNNGNNKKQQRRKPEKAKKVKLVVGMICSNCRKNTKPGYCIYCPKTEQHPVKICSNCRKGNKCILCGKGNTSVNGKSCNKCTPKDHCYKCGA